MGRRIENLTTYLRVTNMFTFSHHSEDCKKSVQAVKSILKRGIELTLRLLKVLKGSLCNVKCFFVVSYS